MHDGTGNTIDHMIDAMARSVPRAAAATAIIGAMALLPVVPAALYAAQCAAWQLVQL